MPGNADPEAMPRILIEPREAEPLGIGSQEYPGNQLIDFYSFTRYQALPGNAYPEAMPPIFMETLRGRSEALPLDIGSQAQPGS